MSEDRDGPQEPLVSNEGSNETAGGASSNPVSGVSGDVLTGSQKVRKKWPWLVGVPIGVLVLLVVVGAIVGPAKKPATNQANYRRSTTTTLLATTLTPTTVPPTTTIPLTSATWLSQYGGIFATLLNDVADINSSTPPTGGETADSLQQSRCKQLQDDALNAAGLPPNPNTAAATAFQNMLNQDITGVDPTDVGNSAPVNAGTLSSGAQACSTDPDPANTYGHASPNDHIFVIVANAPALIQTAQKAAQAAAPGVGIPSATTTTTTSAPSVVLKVTGSGPATTITIDADGNETQQNDRSLPWTDSLGNIPGETVLGAQSSSGSSSASITCEIDYPGQSPVIQTSTGPYANVECSASAG